jgi:hypothetical protein
MKTAKPWILAAAFGAAAFASSGARGYEAPGQAPAVSLRYATSCAVADPDVVDGYVTNASSDVYQVVGQVRFVFSSDKDMSRPAIVFPANTLVPPGQTVRVAHVKLAFQPLPGETCRFEAGETIRKH